MSPSSAFHTPKLLLALKRHLQSLHTSFKQLSFSPIATMMTFAVIGIALALPMGLFVGLKNVQTISSGLHDTMQISVYLDRDTQPIQLGVLQTSFGKNPEIVSQRYISPQEGLQSFEKTVGFREAISELKENPLPGVIVLQPAPDIKSQAQLNQLMTHLKRLSHVNQVQLDLAWLQRLHAMLLLARRVSYALMLLFAFAVLLIIGNTIRLTTQYYRNEILVAKLLGGSDSFIRRPFLYSGIIYGFVGGIIAWLLVDLAVIWLTGPSKELASLYGSQFRIQGLNLHSTLLLLFGGSLLGYLGSRIATNQYLKKMEP